MLDPADVLVHRQPVAGRLPVDGRGGQVRAGVAGEIPGGLDKGVQGVGLAPGRPAALRAGGGDEVRLLVQGLVPPPGLAGTGQEHRQVTFGNGHDAAAVAVDHRDGRAPVALPGDAPVAQPVGDVRPAEPLRLGMGDDRRLGGNGIHGAERAGIHQRARFHRGLGHGRRVEGFAPGLDHHPHRQAVGTGEFEVALVVGRHRHDRAGAVFHEHEVGRIDRHPLAGEGVAAVRAGEHAAFFLLLLQAGPLLVDERLLDEGLDRGLLGGARGQGSEQGVLHRQRHETHAEDGVRPGGEDGDLLVAALHREVAGEPGALADPVALHGDHLLRPAGELVQVGEQFLGVVGDPEEPAVHYLGQYRLVAPPAGAVDHLFAGEHGLAVVTPVDRGLLAVDEPAFEHLQEEALLPAVVVRAAGGQLPVPVIAQPHGLELGAHVGDVVPGPGGRVDAALHGRVLGGQAEGVPAHGVEDVEPLHALVAGDHVTDGVVAHVPHVDAARGVGEHLEHVVFFPAGLCVDLEGLVPLPALLPFAFDGLEIVSVGGLLHGHGGRWGSGGWAQWRSKSAPGSGSGR